MKQTILIAIVAAISVFYACENEQNEINSDFHISSFRVSPAEVRIKVGDSVSLDAQLIDTTLAGIKSDNMPDNSLVWQLIVGGGTISGTKGSSIKYYAPASMPDQEMLVVVNAIPWMDTRWTKSVKITVYNEEVPLDTGLCFSRDILPIFFSNCAMSGCHDAKTHKEGYVLDNYTNIRKKGIKPGNPTGSKIYKSLFDDDDIMPPPPMSPLSTEQKALIFRWILEGATNSECNTNPNTGCDTTNITYSKTLMPIMQNYCLGCHNNSQAQGNVNLQGYDNVKKYMLAGSFMGSIRHESGYVAMPSAVIKLSDCNIKQFQKWFEAGMPNN